MGGVLPTDLLSRWTGVSKCVSEEEGGGSSADASSVSASLKITFQTDRRTEGKFMSRRGFRSESRFRARLFCPRRFLPDVSADSELGKNESGHPDFRMTCLYRVFISE